MIIYPSRMQNRVNVRGIGYSTFTGKNPVVIYVEKIPTEQAASYDFDIKAHQLTI
jgi:hypothetical protein